MRRRAGVAAACVLLLAGGCARSEEPRTTAAPTGGAGTDLSRQSSGSTGCDGFRVEWSNAGEGAEDEPATLRVKRGEHVVVDLRTEDGFERLQPHRCADLTGDGRPELLYERFTGGAHCCFEAEVIGLHEPETRLLNVDLGNYGGLEPRQLDEDEAFELVGSSDVFAYFHVSFASSPAIPLVFDLDGETYVVATGDFPDLVMTHIEEEIALIADYGDDVSEEVLRGTAVGIYGSYLVLGRGDEGLRVVEQRLPAVSQWLAGIAEEAGTRFEEGYGESRFTREGEPPA